MHKLVSAIEDYGFSDKHGNPLGGCVEWLELLGMIGYFKEADTDEVLRDLGVNLFDGTTG